MRAEQDAAHDDDLFAAEIGRLESEQRRSILRKKHHG
jgi:hypothetical protein